MAVLVAERRIGNSGEFAGDRQTRADFHLAFHADAEGMPGRLINDGGNAERHDDCRGRAAKLTLDVVELAARTVSSRFLAPELVADKTTKPHASLWYVVEYADIAGGIEQTILFHVTGRVGKLYLVEEK